MANSLTAIRAGTFQVAGDGSLSLTAQPWQNAVLTISGWATSWTAPNGNPGKGFTYTTGNATVNGANGGDFTVNLGTGLTTGRYGQFATNGGYILMTAPAAYADGGASGVNTGPLGGGWATINTSITGAQTTQGYAVRTNLAFTGLTQAYAGTVYAFNTRLTTDTSAQNYTGLLTAGEFDINVVSTGTVSEAFAGAAFLTLEPTATGSVTIGYGFNGEVDLLSTGAMTAGTIAGLSGLVNIELGSTVVCTDGRGLTATVQTIAASTGTYTTATGVWGQAQHGNSATITTGLGASLRYNGAGAGTVTNAYGLQGYVTASVATHVITTSATGVNGYVILGLTTTVPTVSAFASSVSNTGAGIMTNVYNYYAASPVNSGAGSITNAYGMRILNQGLAGSTLSIGLLIDAQSGATTSRALQTAGGAVALNGFAGNVGAITLGNSTSTTAVSINLGAASTWTLFAATANALQITDSTAAYVAWDTRIATDNVVTTTLGAGAISYASANGSTYTNTKIKATTVNWTGGTTVTAAEGLQHYVDANTMTAGGATTVTQASGAIFAGLKPGANITLTTGIHAHFLDGPAKVGTYTNQVAVKIDSLTQGATANIALWVQNPIQVGSASLATNNQIHTATQGAGSTQLFIGNSSINVTSDARLKANITDTTRDALALVRKLHVVDFDWDNPADKAGAFNRRGRWTGMIAQEMVEHVPWVVNKPGNPSDYWFVEYHHLVPLLVKALQQTTDRLESLERHIAA